MSVCEPYTQSAGNGVASALRAVDCLANDTAQGAFERMFGSSGALTTAMTIVLTIYVAFFAISLMTGRSRIGVSALTPRMLTVGLVLTFVTSWIAYQSVVWNLAVGGPDQIAGAVLGRSGSASQMFGHRIDLVFSAIVEAAENGAGAAPASATPGAAAPASAPPTAATLFSPANLMWISALMLLLGTVGVLVTARIALAVLLVLGPVFIVMALFKGTRGLFAGWLRGVLLTALTPLLAVLGGSFSLELAIPAINALRGAEGVDGQAAITLFVIASVHVALMLMVLKVASTMVAGWSVFGMAGERMAARPGSDWRPPMMVTPPQVGAAAPALVPTAGSRRTIAAGPLPAASPAESGATVSGNPLHVRGRADLHPHVGPAFSPANLPRQRARGIGSRFGATPRISREIIR